VRAERALAALVPDPSTLEPVTDAVGELAALAARVLAHEAGAARLVAELDTVAGEWDSTRAEVVLHEHALDRAASILTAMARLGFDERRVQLEEAQTHMMKAVLDLWKDSVLTLFAAQFGHGAVYALEPDVRRLARQALETAATITTTITGES
jgi:hypothetical protein